MQRIQRKRTAGWRMPPDTLCVTRGTRWGNPYTVDPNDSGSRLRALMAFRHHLELMKERNPAEYENYIAPLRGKNLACFCNLSERCHASILLELAAEPIAQPAALSPMPASR